MFTMRPDRRTFGFHVVPDDDVPGFRMNADGTSPGDFPQSDGARPSGSDRFPSGIAPVDCTVSDGDLSCLSPQGTSFHPPIPAPRGFPERIGPENRLYHGYGVQSPPTDVPAERLLQGLINNPTPGPEFMNHPATFAGTPNEATPWLAYGLYLGATRLPAGTPLSPVQSHLRHDQFGNPVIVNVTEPGHPLFPGYVIHSIVQTPDGPAIRTEGEGLAKWQAPDSPQWVREELSDKTWRPYQDKIIEQAR